MEIIDNKFELEELYIGMDIKDKAQSSSIVMVHGSCSSKVLIQVYIR